MNQTYKNKQAPSATKPVSNPQQQQTIKTQINIPKQNARSDIAATKVAKQTYLKRTDGNNLQLPHGHSANHPIQIINAPTSLTNLAQFSGITILPIGNISSNVIHGKQILPCNVLPNVSLQQMSPSCNQQQYISPTAAVSTHQINQQQSISVNHVNMVGSSSQQPAYNLNSTSSVQLLSQNSIDSTQTYWRNMPNSKTNNNFQPKQSSTLPNISNRVNNRRDRAQNDFNNLHSYPKDLQVIPISDGLPLLAEVSDLQPTLLGSSFDDVSTPSSELLASGQYGGETKEDANNVSLMKLIAILNNPALTVTAVSNRNPTAILNQVGVSEHRQSLSVDLSNSSLAGVSNGLFRPVNLPTSDYFSPATRQINEKQKRADTSIPKNRIPQSAANLQVIHNEAANCLSALKRRLPSENPSLSISERGNVTSKDFSSSPITSSTPKHSSLKLDWLPDYNSTSSAASNNSTASIFRTDNSLSKHENTSYLHDKHNDPLLLSTSVRNLMMQQLPSSTKQQAVSVQLLKHIANQTKDNDWIPDQAQKSILEPECILSIPRKIQQLNQVAKRIKSSHKVTTSAAAKKESKGPIQTSEHRLYIPRAGQVLCESTKIAYEPALNCIRIDGCEERMVHVSERHFMLDSMMSSSNNKQFKSAMAEPDEIFINRSKRIMSKIDTMIERKKRRRFERISGRAAPKVSSLEDQCAESENEWSDDDNMDLDSVGFIKTQLPLEEIETKEKRNHLLTVGLVSRNEHNKLLIEECERKSVIFTPLGLEQPNGVSGELKRFIDTILKTGGTDVQLRTESNIKRNDLPLIEGLNRNTSRMKMHYMNVLGLEKRSKRTTLYKVKQVENSNTPKLIDLNKINSANMEKLESKLGVSINSVVDIPAVINPILLPSLTITSCRDVVQSPNKYEYMKSLGLMAS